MGVIFFASCKLTEIVGYPIDYKTALKLHAGAVGIATVIGLALGVVGLGIALFAKNRIKSQTDKELEEIEKMKQEALKKL